MPAPPRLLMNGIRKSFGPTAALSGVEFSVAPGEVHALVGENGAGKSTLMQILSGALQPDAGNMELDGAAYSPRDPLDARARGVSIVYQELSLAPHLTVAENILLGQEPGKFGVLSQREMLEKATRALSGLGHSNVRPEMIAGRLSPGEQQLVELARAMAMDAKVLILDEPTSSLAREDVERLFQLIADLKMRGVSVIYISHFLEEVKRIGDRFTVLRDGASVSSGACAESTPKELASRMAGRKLDDFFPKIPRTQGEVILELTALAGVPKPENASLSLRRGEVLGLAGLVGAGRTELMRALFGLDPIRSGTVKLGVYSGSASPAQRLNQGMGLLSEDRKNEGLAHHLSLADNCTLSKMQDLGAWPGLLSPSKQAAATQTWIEKLSVRCRGPQERVSRLSGGNQQKIALARLLHHDVDVLLLDEPTRGIDVGSKAEIYRLIGEEAARGKAVLVVSSYLPELLGICDRIAVMCRGILGPAHPVAECSEQSLLLEATGVAA